MVKLIRLTTTDNATFESNLDSEIKLGANAQVALRNLTFESDFDVFNTVTENNLVSTNFDIPDYEFSLVGYIAARQFATEQCEIRTQALKIKDQYKITMR